MGILRKVGGLVLGHEEGWGKRGQYYVYDIIDPRFEPPRVIYVGKGLGDRMYQHEKDMRRYLKRGSAMKLTCLHKRILEIIDDGYTVGYNVSFRTDNEEEAYQAESKRINRFGLERLCNEVYGYRPRRRR